MLLYSIFISNIAENTEEDKCCCGSTSPSIHSNIHKDGAFISSTAQMPVTNRNYFGCTQNQGFTILGGEIKLRLSITKKYPAQLE